jgi:hypothetical protein
MMIDINRLTDDQLQRWTAGITTLCEVLSENPDLVPDALMTSFIIHESDCCQQLVERGLIEIIDLDDTQPLAAALADDEDDEPHCPRCGYWLHNCQCAESPPPPLSPGDLSSFSDFIAGWTSTTQRRCDDG